MNVFGPRLQAVQAICERDVTWLGSYGSMDDLYKSRAVLLLISSAIQYQVSGNHIKMA